MIASFEGCSLKAYKDVAGVTTIGYGTIMYRDGKRVQMGETITQEQANDLLHWQIYLKEVAVARLTRNVQLSQNRFDALVSFAYNLGIGALETSSLLKMIKVNQHNYDIRDEFLKWCKAKVVGQGTRVTVPGLLKRRQKEAELWFRI